MNELANNGGCAPLMEACTLELYQKNIFRVTGLPVDATSKEVSRQAQKLQMLEEMGGAGTGLQPAFPLAVPPTTDELRAALSRMKEPEHRIIDEFFWYWPEEFGSSKSDAAIQAMLAGDTEGAVRLWRDREKSGSHVAQHNMAIMYHMYAVDWTNYHVSYEIDHALDEQIKGYWRKSFERWEEIVDADYIWDMMKERVRSLDDEALTTGFVRRMLKQLPQALDMVNADAALKLAEQGRLDWARFHVDLMNETHQGLDDVESTSEMVLAPTRARVKQHLTNCKERTKKDPKRGTDFAVELLSLCRPVMDLFDLFHGEDAHQRNDLFDEVAETVIGIADVDWGANKNAQRILPIFKTALELATGIHLRGRIIKEISDIEGLVAREELAPIFYVLEEINDSKDKADLKLEKINNRILPKLPELSQQYGHQSETVSNLCDSIAIVLKGIAVAAHNDESDHTTALAAIQLASRLVRKSDFKSRIQTDKETIERNTGTSVCFYCGKKPGEAKRKVGVPMHKVTEVLTNGVRFQSNSFSIPRCDTCYQNHRKHWQAIWWGAGAGALLGAPFAPWALVGGAMIAILSLGGWISWLLLRDQSDGRLGCFGIGGTLFGALACFNIAEDSIGKNLLLNALGGAVILAFIAFWIAKKIINPKSPENQAMTSPEIVGLGKVGWKPGAKP